MSLINQMLRDLETRKAPAVFDSGGEVLLTGGEPRLRRGRQWLLTGGLLLIMLVWLGLGMWRSRTVSGGEQVASVESVADALKRPEIAANSVAVATQAPPVSQRSETTDPPRPVSALPPLPPGDVVQRAGEMTTPEGNLLDIRFLERVDSARLVLEFSQLPGYRLLPEKAVGKSFELIVPAASRDPKLVIPRLNGGLLTAAGLRNDGPDLHLQLALARAARLKIMNLPADSFHGERLLLDFTPIPAPRVSAMGNKETSIETSALRSPPAKAVPVRNGAGKTMASVQVRASRAYAAALRSLDGGEDLVAERHLRNALEFRPDLLEARLSLVQLLLHRQQADAAVSLLRSGLRLQPQSAVLRQTLARILFDRRQLDQALALLNAPPLPAVAEAPEYHALLAALLREAGRSDAAVEEYARLLVVRPREPLWWLGLAIAFEQSGKTDPARNAYHNALELPGLSPDLTKYIRTRLQAL